MPRGQGILEITIRTWGSPRILSNWHLLMAQQHTTPEWWQPSVYTRYAAMKQGYRSCQPSRAEQEHDLIPARSSCNRYRADSYSKEAAETSPSFETAVLKPRTTHPTQNWQSNPSPSPPGHSPAVDRGMWKPGQRSPTPRTFHCVALAKKRVLGV